MLYSSMKRLLTQKRKLFIFLIIVIGLVPILAFGYLLFQLILPAPDSNENTSQNQTDEEPIPFSDIPMPERVGDDDVPESLPKTEFPTPSKTPTNETTQTKNWWEYPTKIYTTQRSGNDLLVLVNKQYKLPSTYTPSDLIDAKTAGIRTKNNGSYYVRSVLKNSLKALNNAAKEDGIDISVISAYRSYSTQAGTYQYWVSYNDGCVSCADKVSARPGHSQHQLGTAIDFSTNQIGDRLGAEFTNTKAEKWLRSNAYKYGFVISYPSGYETETGYSYESWHYRYIGQENALEMKNSGDILELYLRSKN